MKIVFLNEGAFGTYKNKSDKESRKEKLKRGTSNISKKAARDEIKKFYGKVLKEYAIEASKTVVKNCQFNDVRTLNFDVAATFDIHTNIGWGGRISGNSHELFDYENIAGSLYSTRECLDSNHESLVIPVEVTSDNGFIEQSIITKNIFYKTVVRVFNKCVEKVAMKEDLPLGFSKPKEYKLLLLSSYNTSPWGHYNNEVPPLETLYESIFNGTFDGTLDEIIATGKYNDMNITSNKASAKYVYFFGSKDVEENGEGWARLRIHDAKEITEIVKTYPKIILNPRHWNSFDITTLYTNSTNKEFFDFINECTKNEIGIYSIDFKDNFDYGKSSNNNVSAGVDRALNITKIVDKLKSSCPGLDNTILNFPENISGGGFMISADKKFLASKVDSKNTTSFTTLGKNIGIIKPAGKFVRNIYAIDVTSPSLKNDLMKMIKLGSTNQDNIDISGKYETAIIAGVADHMIATFKKLLTLRPHCCAGNYLLFCSYTQDEMNALDEIIRIGFAELKEVKNKLTIQAAYDFKLACAQGFNPKYTASKSQQNAGKSYEYIAGKKTRIEIPV